MKKEVEFMWIIKLLNCQYIKGGIFRKQIGGCKADFERVVGIPEKNKEFRKWLNLLIDKEILEFFEKRKNVGGFIDTFVIVYKKLEKKLMKNPIYDPTIRYMERNKFLFRTVK